MKEINMNETYPNDELGVNNYKIIILFTLLPVTKLYWSLI